MDIITPNPGLIFWTTFSFIILFVILRKYAWPAILTALKVREETIAFALQDARKAREEAEKMDKTRRQMLEETRRERDTIIREAGELKKQILVEAREIAHKETERQLEKAREQISKEKQDAINQIKQSISELSLSIAEKILKEELSNQAKHEKLISSYLDEASFN